MSEAQEPVDFGQVTKLENTVETLPELNNLNKQMYDGKICSMCREKFFSGEKDDPDAIYVEVSSWVTGPKLQSPVLRSHTGRYAHSRCVQKVLDGEAPDQEPIPGLSE